ncbi:MAG: HDOD domain-containing protein [Armatimonadetes bacterium]|nr:HDOD domain-containing protein [Armatimonadota bacterium]
MSDSNWMHVAPPSVDFDALLAKFRSAESLPDLPASALQLCDAIDKGDAETGQLEKIILSDPAITGSVLKAANSALYGGKSNNASTVKGAILLLGQKAIRSIAVSVWVQSLVHQSKGSPKFDPAKFAAHSMFVGFLSKYLLSTVTRTKSVKSAWTPDELFAAGVLHDLGIGLLASIDAKLYEAAQSFAAANGKSLNQSFLEVTGRSVDILSVAAAQAWKLPDLFVDVLMGQSEPLLADKEVDALCCVNYAEYLAQRTGYALSDWRVEAVIEPEVEERVGLSPDDVSDVLELVAGLTTEFVAAA